MGLMKLCSMVYIQGTELMQHVYTPVQGLEYDFTVQNLLQLKIYLQYYNYYHLAQFLSQLGLLITKINL